MTQTPMIRLPDGGMVPRLGLGTWAIGGRWTAGGEAAGWGDTSDDQSLAAIRAAAEAGIRLFDTAQAYGAGHSETLLGRALAGHPEVRIVTKVGLVIDEDARSLERPTTDPDEIEASLEGSRRRLRRDRIDVVLLHLNSLPPDKAAPVFDRLESLRAKGRLAVYGWSTDYWNSVGEMAGRPGFVAVEHAMNVFFAATDMGATADRLGLLSLIRSPLAMGLLGGRIRAGHRFDAGDVRARTTDWMDYFKDGGIAPAYADRLAVVRDLLTAGGRTLAQGALGWIMARRALALPVPGFRTPAQVADLCGALTQGPLDAATVAAVEAALDRPPEGPARDR